MGCLTGAAFGQSNLAVKLTGVDVEGAQRIELETIRSYLLIKPGEEITPRKLDESLKKNICHWFICRCFIKTSGR